MGTKEGHIDKRGVIWHGTVYRLRITTMAGLLSLISLLKPCLKHAKRINDMENSEKSILERVKRIQKSNR